MNISSTPIKFASAQVSKAPVQRAKADFQAAEQQETNSPAVQDESRGFGSFLKKLFSNIGSFFNKKGHQLDAANADANLLQEIDNLKGNVERVRNLSNEIKANAIVAGKKYAAAQEKYDKEKGEAVVWAKKYQSETDEKKKADYKKIAEQEAMEWKEAEKALNEAKAELGKLDTQAKAADAQKALYEKQATDMKKKLEDGRTAIKRAEVKEKMGALQNELKEAAGQGFATSHTSELLEEINLREAKADAALGDQADILEKQRLQEIKDDMEKDGALNSALSELLGAETQKADTAATKAAASGGTTPAPAKTEGESALDELNKMTNKQS